jgi:hypothetical protein
MSIMTRATSRAGTAYVLKRLCSPPVLLGFACLNICFAEQCLSFSFGLILLLLLLLLLNKLDELTFPLQTCI